MYYGVLLLLIVFSVIEIWRGDKKNILFHAAFLILVLMLCLRYGQGTDYFGYRCNYDTIDFHSEIGFRILSRLCKSLGLSFEVFVGMISLFQMICLYRGICLYSPVKTLSLLLFYPTLYLTYCFSGIRQGIVILFFLGFMIKWLQEEKYFRYVVSCLVMAGFHSAALMFIPLLAIKRIKIKWLYRCMVLALGIGVFIYIVPAEWFSFIAIGSVQFYINSISISVMGLAERIVMFAILTFLFWKNIEFRENSQAIFLYKIYTVGFLTAIMFFPWALLSSRMGAAMKAVEIFLFPMFLKEKINWRKLLILFLTLYTVVMTVKNIWSYLGQAGDEYREYNVLTYPYFSVFEKEKVHEVRKNVYAHYLWCIDLYESGGLE